MRPDTTSPARPGSAGPARPHVPTSPHACPACPSGAVRAGCSACCGRGRLWLPVELDAWPGALDRVLGDLAVHGRTATRPLPGARLAADGQVHYGTWHSLHAADLPPDDPRRRLWLAPAAPVALRLFDSAPTATAEPAEPGRLARLEPAGPARRPGHGPAVAAPGRARVGVEHRFAAKAPEWPADGRTAIPTTARYTPRADLGPPHASSDAVGSRAWPGAAPRRVRPR
jgi:hypothetical protein